MSYVVELVSDARTSAIAAECKRLAVVTYLCGTWCLFPSSVIRRPHMQMSLSISLSRQ